MTEFEMLQLAIDIATKHGRHNQKAHGMRGGGSGGMAADKGGGAGGGAGGASVGEAESTIARIMKLGESREEAISFIGGIGAQRVKSLNRMNETLNDRFKEFASNARRAKKFDKEVDEEKLKQHRREVRKINEEYRALQDNRVAAVEAGRTANKTGRSTSEDDEIVSAFNGTSSFTALEQRMKALDDEIRVFNYGRGYVIR